MRKNQVHMKISNRIFGYRGLITLLLLMSNVLNRVFIHSEVERINIIKNTSKELMVRGSMSDDNPRLTNSSNPK